MGQAPPCSFPVCVQYTCRFFPEKYSAGTGCRRIYLLCTKEDFEWFISTVRQGDTEINVRLKNDLILHDTSNWENWADTPPENKFNPMIDYNGHFDGGGFALEGYYSNFKGTWQAFIFTNLEENARITNLHIRNSFFRTSFEDSSYENDDGRTDVVAAFVLCFSNEGIIEGCDVHARVMGAWNAGGIVGINYGQIRDCCFSGSVEAGLAKETEEPENAAFYRVRDGFLAEYVGIEPTEEDWNVLERARYLAAEIDNALITSEVQSDCEEFCGKENWDFPLLHNPFAAALCYSKDAECSSYMLFTGAQ